MRADSDDGKRVLEELLKCTREELFENVEKISNGLKVLTADDLWHNTARGDDIPPEERSLEYEPSMFRYFCSKLGEYKGPSINLYDNDGEGIRDLDHYKSVMSGWDKTYSSDNPYKDLLIWLVLADIHY